MSFGSLLRKLRGERTASSVARAVGLSPQYWSDVERGQRPPFGPEHIKRIARELRVPLAPLLEAYEEHQGGWWIDRKGVPPDARVIVASCARERWSAELWAAMVDVWRKHGAKP